MKTLGNIIWFIFGGFMIAIEYFIASVALMITIVGIPFAFQTLKLAMLSIWPFGSRVMTIDDSWGCLNIVMNVIWFFVGGFWIALTHLAWGIILCITLFGIPFGLQHFKLIKLALFPFGRQVVAA